MIDIAFFVDGENYSPFKAGQYWPFPKYYINICRNIEKNLFLKKQKFSTPSNPAALKFFANFIKIYHNNFFRLSLNTYKESYYQSLIPYYLIPSKLWPKIEKLMLNKILFNL